MSYETLVCEHTTEKITDGKVDLTFVFQVSGQLKQMVS